MFRSLFAPAKRRLDSLTEQEVLALAISSEEDDARIYLAYAERLKDQYPQSAKVFKDMAEVEHTHRNMLIDMHRQRFGEHIPLIRREHVQGFMTRKPDWLQAQLSVDQVREEAEAMERSAYNFYVEAQKHVSDARTRTLLGDLAMAEQGHEDVAHMLGEKHRPEDVQKLEQETTKRQFVLTYVQPGLAGLMDGSVSTLAPIFAAAFATGDTWQTFLVGLSASVGAGISMGFTEASHDDGKISGRGSPIKRGLACGIMTALGGLGHALPYLIPHFWTATATAGVVVFIELWAIAFIQNKYMETPFWRAAMQVVLGGSLVLAAGILIGSG
ncbi:rubrerythrin family protein [Agrobacterium vitis]|uniref:Rubrerythrin family protein n=1 Tax=Agrobacterium vitis TaxID=373 RepID=A0AAE4WD57_AGRVI|nr:ferritin family protein [Agrobacterium vitis]MCF1499450.1 rubrerythrin family protein [Allorhizobium sp. Av2]MCM2439298.1 rubrerythrin family protein [Agrobacterium vitis]MUZ57798.1 rubrerythrin family protein [Agrobacterium vitis]MVA67802.1 rubrerythrin family protein [Agrobacterium vitis]MVA87703.1 rubrerythrin family protein [Agrobacterium vitis]